MKKYMEVPKKKNKIGIILGVVAVLGALAAVAHFAYKRFTNEDKYEEFDDVYEDGIFDEFDEEADLEKKIKEAAK